MDRDFMSILIVMTMCNDKKTLLHRIRWLSMVNDLEDSDTTLKFLLQKSEIENPWLKFWKVEIKHYKKFLKHTRRLTQRVKKAISYNKL